MCPVDLYLLQILNQITKAVIASMEKYDITNAMKQIIDFIKDDVSSNFSEIFKHRLYFNEPNSLARRSAQTTRNPFKPLSIYFF